MTDSAIAATPTATPAAVFLAAAGRPLELAPYCGVLTPCELDVRPVEIEALATSAALHDLGWLRRFAVRGSDRFRWLSGMVTNTVSDLGANSGAWNLVLNAQGRIQGDLTTWRMGTGTDQDTLEIVVDAAQSEKLIAHLDRFIIMDDVELMPVGQQSGDAALELTAIGLTGPRAGDVLSRAGLPMLSEPMTLVDAEWNGLGVRIRRGHGALAQHYALWVPVSGAAQLWRFLSTAGATPVGSRALDAFRIAEGIPQYGLDMQERDLPQETSQTATLHFSKGCYLGQEIVERIRSRGNVHRHLRQIELSHPLPGEGLPDAGTELMLAGQPAGVLTSAASLPLASGPRTFALAMLRAEAEARPAEFLTYTHGGASGQARILPGPPTL